MIEIEFHINEAANKSSFGKQPADTITIESREQQFGSNCFMCLRS